METRGRGETKWHGVEGDEEIVRTKQMRNNKWERGRGEGGLRSVGGD